ncbi:MAG: S-layer homology domain-containing protein [Clostridia bacterium]|nr:S-layer homology domain-containing protein [Clostridia bacterium]
MKFKHTQIFTIIILIIYILSSIPCILFAEDESPLLYFDFEEASSEGVWIGAARDTLCAFEGEWGILASNPYGDDHTGIFGHILQYDDYIHLEDGGIYTFSAYVMNPMANTDSVPSASAYIGRNGGELFIDISSVGYDWSMVTASFMATENTDIPLSITFEGGDSDVGFFVDNISVTRETRKPDYTMLKGPESVYIPDMGFIDYRYSLVTYDTDDLPINILLNNPTVTIENMPEGVEYFESDGTLRVFSDAPANITFTLTYEGSTVFDTEVATIEVTTTKNLLSDPSFENGEENWVSDGDIAYSDGSIALYAEEEGEWGKAASMTYTKQLLLYADNMYVFRADVGSDESFSSSSVYISNLSFASSGYAEINITGIGGEWSNVTSAFLIEDTGLYDLTINLYAPTERPIYVDNVFFGTEKEAPASVSIHAPGHIQIPSDTLTLPCYGLVRNQLSEVMEDFECTVSISPDDEGATLEDGYITVSRHTRAGDYTITATFDGISSEHVITVSDNAVGDGGFEEKQPDEWWTASDGAFFSIIDYNGGKAAHVHSPDSSCIVINNSYMELIEGNYYVYSASPGFGEGTVTAFIADNDTGEYIPLGQYTPLESTKIPFTVDKNVIGRLVLYIEAEGSVGLIFDDIAISPYELTATDVIAEGGEYGDFIRGSYIYVNNMTDAPDADISSTRWYISSSFEGHYEPIGIPNQDYLEFTPDMAGQFIIYEVTPVCAYTGLVGDSIRSLPVKIGQPYDDKDTPIISPMTPVELEAVENHPFMDITAHWAEGMISSLASAGVISGKSANRFVPDYYVTRAEFTAMVARAFSLVSVPYSGQFDDINADDWYSGWVEAAYKRGIITGVDENTFAPNERITREQMSTIVYRAYLLADGPLPYDMDLRYYDSFMISPWAYESVRNCTNLNILTGKEISLFKPRDFATRAEAAAVIYRTLKSF